MTDAKLAPQAPEENNENDDERILLITLTKGAPVPPELLGEMLGITTLQFLLDICKEKDYDPNIAVINWDVLITLCRLVENPPALDTESEESDDEDDELPREVVFEEAESALSLFTVADILDKVCQHNFNLDTASVGCSIGPDGVLEIFVFERTTN